MSDTFGPLFSPTAEYDEEPSVLDALMERARCPTPNEPEVNFLEAYENHFDEVFSDSRPARARLIAQFFNPK